MKKVVVGDCRTGSVLELVDPTGFSEAEYEVEVIKALQCLMPDYWCGVFSGSFVLDGQRSKADLALVHKTLSHWFVVEVEIVAHSLVHHVLPQVRCFRFGEADESCVTSLCRAFSHLGEAQARSILLELPRYVAVIANMYDCSWHQALLVSDVQYLVVSVFRSGEGLVGYEMDGVLNASSRSVGFAEFSATDKCLRIAAGCGLPVGELQLKDQFGVRSTWFIEESSGVLWISKRRGESLFSHGDYVQILQDMRGEYTLRLSSKSGRRGR